MPIGEVECNALGIVQDRKLFVAQIGRKAVGINILATQYLVDTFKASASEPISNRDA